MEEYVLVCWPESQELMEREGFDEHSSIADCENFDSGAYFVEKDWLNETNPKSSTEGKKSTSVCFGRDDLLSAAENIANEVGNINIAEELCNRMAEAGNKFIDELEAGGTFSYTRVNP